ncbi:LysR family transcriptional regulator substrate-binding protein [Corticicoccus populi]|uniref:LysR family transcriptional regulator substrate-binding protein n=1 Tax=Corticicoccus populi TaxID=1812821 RepID=A0ABW5WUW0_9STAP
MLFQYTSQIFEWVNQAENAIFSMKNLNSGTLSIGGSDSTFKHYLLPYIQSFQDLYPDIHIQLRHGSTPEIINKLSNQQIDIGFVHLPVQAEHIEINHFMDIDSVFAGGKNYRYLNEKILTLEDIKKYPLISFSEGSSSRKFLDQLFQRSQLEVYPDIEVGSVELLIETAKMNMGIVFITKELIQNHLNSGELFEISVDIPIEKRKIGVAVNQNMPQSVTVNEFLKHINQSV